jgi:hypothetical protein
LKPPRSTKLRRRGQDEQDSCADSSPAFPDIQKNFRRETEIQDSRFCSLVKAVVYIFACRLDGGVQGKFAAIARPQTGPGTGKNKGCVIAFMDFLLVFCFTSIPDRFDIGRVY